MPRWKKKPEEVEEKEMKNKEDETPLETEDEVVKEETNDIDRAYEAKTHEVMYQMNKGMEWAADISGAIRRALEDRTPLVMTERDLDALEFYTIVLSYTNPETLAKVFLKSEAEERAKRENDVSVS